MRKNYGDTSDMQNRFTAYLVKAINHTKIQYCEKKERIRQHELISVEEYEKNYTNFDREFMRYIGEQYAIYFTDLQKMQDLLWVLEGEQLVKVLKRLSEQERRILFCRIFGEQSFQDIGEGLGMAPKQAEQAYYYVVRKLRKKLGVKNNGI